MRRCDAIMTFKKYYLYLTLLLLLGCTSPNGGSNGQENNYETTKKMVTDILKTDEGKQTIAEILADEETQQAYVIHDQVVKSTLEEVLTSEQGKTFWSKMFSDQEFVKEFAEAMSTQHEEVFKRLMGDATFQGKMLELLANPEVDAQIISLLKSQQFKVELENNIKEILESPLFKAQVAEILVKNAKEINKPSGQEEQNQDDTDTNQSEEKKQS